MLNTGVERISEQHLTPAVIRQYVMGALPGRKRHAVERHCLDCPLCSDALESFSARPQRSFLGRDLVELNRRLAERANQNFRKTKPLVLQPWSIAATLLLLLLASVTLITNQLQTGAPVSEARIDTPVYPDTLVLYQQPALVLVRNDRRRETARQASADAYESYLRSADGTKPAFSTPSLNLDPRPEAKVAARNPATSPRKSAADPFMEAVTDAEISEKKNSTPVVAHSETKAERSNANGRMKGFESVVGSGARKDSARPQPEGGYATFEDYLARQIRYPDLARQRQVAGTVGLEFTVEPDGTLTNFKVLKSLGYGCDEEAIRVLQQGPKWQPGWVNNQPVRKRVKTQIRFKH